MARWQEHGVDDASKDFMNAGCAPSEWSDVAVPLHPTALQPFTPPATAWSVSMEGWPAVVQGASVALGLTTSAVTMSKLENGKTGAWLPTGVVDDGTWNRMAISCDPAAQVMSASLNGVSLGPCPMKLKPRSLGFEGVGILDNFVVRKRGAAAV